MTQCVHKAGARLEGIGAGKTFTIRAIPTTLVLSETERKIVEFYSELTQTAFKPKAAKGSY